MKDLVRSAASLPLLCLCALGLFGCPPHGGTQGGGHTTTGGEHPRIEAKKDPAADQALEQAIQVADTQGKQKGVEAYLAVRKAYPESTAGEEALYRAGLLAYDAGDFVTARKSLNELLFENPLFHDANEAKLKLGLAALELKAYRDAYQTLSSVAERLTGEQKKVAMDAAQKAAELGNIGTVALTLAVQAVDQAQSPEEKEAALNKLIDVVESSADFTDIRAAREKLAQDHPAWPVLTFKLARIFYHLRDWSNLNDTLDEFMKVSPNSPYAPQAKEMLARSHARENVKPKVVGVVLPVTGKYKPIGDAVLRGIQLAMQGSDIELVVKDTQGDVQLAGKALEELAFDDGAIAAMGPLLADDSKRAALVAEELQIPLLTMTRTEDITGIGPHVFRNMLTNSGQAEALAEYGTKKLGFKHFAVLYPDIPYGKELTNEFWDAVIERGADVRGAEAYEHDQTTFTAEAKKLVGRYWMLDRADYLEGLRQINASGDDDFRKRKAREKLQSTLDPIVDFDALLIPDDWKRVGLVAPALAVEDIITNACDPRDLDKIKKTTGKKDLKTVTLLGTNQWSSPKGRSGLPELVERGGKFVTCSIYVDGFYVDSNRPATKKFVAAYKAANGGNDPGLLEAIGYDSAAMFRQVIEKNAPKTREQFREDLQVLKGFDGATGTTSFTDKREAQKPLFFLSIDSKGVKELPPIEVSQPSSGTPTGSR
ncbi:MAG: ABC transporter substrate-binding protein [Myxococcaceae bacterium]